MRHFEARHDNRREKESSSESGKERLARLKAELAEAERDADDAGRAVQEARAFASGEGRSDASAQVELADIEKDADRVLRRYESLRERARRLENPGEFEGAIAEQMVEDAVIAAVVPEPLHAAVETVAPVVKIAVESETEETAEDRRRKKLGEKKKE